MLIVVMASNHLTKCGDRGRNDAVVMTVECFDAVVQLALFFAPILP